jgi:hypothetical protein
MFPKSRQSARSGGVAALALAACVACSNRGAVTKEPAEARPRRQVVVLFSIDTLRADHLGAYGYERPTSPVIDEFAKSAVLFERAIAPAPSTAPTHMSILTGVNPPVHKIFNARPGEGLAPAQLDPALRTFPQMLKARGYLTAGLNGGGFLDGAVGFNRGFDVYSSDLISRRWVMAYKTREDLRAIRTMLDMAESRDRPLFLFLHHYACHSPYVTAPDTMRDRFLEGRKVEGLSTGLPDEMKYRFITEWDRTGAKSITVGGKYVGQGKLRAFWNGIDLSRPDHLAHVVALYDSGVAYADFLFGEVVSILKEAGVYDDALIVLLSDHGEEFFEHGGKEHGRLFVEHLHVPLIVKFPARAGIRSARIAVPVSITDTMPSVFEFLGIPIETPIEGRSFLPLVTGRNAAYRDHVTSYNNHGAVFSGIRIETGASSYALVDPAKGTERLYDKGRDPREQTDLSASDPSTLAGMKAFASRDSEEDALFLERLKGLRESAPSIEPSLVQQLKELGYLK